MGILGTVRLVDLRPGARLHSTETPRMEIERRYGPDILNRMGGALDTIAPPGPGHEVLRLSRQKE